MKRRLFVQAAGAGSALGAALLAGTAPNRRRAGVWGPAFQLCLSPPAATETEGRYALAWARNIWADTPA